MFKTDGSFAALVLYHLPFGPRDIPASGPVLGMGMKYIGHSATARVSTPNSPGEANSGKTVSVKIDKIKIITFVSDHLEGVEIVLNDVLLFVHKLAAVEELQWSQV